MALDSLLDYGYCEKPATGRGLVAEERGVRARKPGLVRHRRHQRERTAESAKIGCHPGAKHHRFGKEGQKKGKR